MVVAVTDLNDLPPMFTRTPRGNVIDVRNDAPVGEVVGTVAASDSDGTAPGNVVRYSTTERGSSDRATKYFIINEETGDISIADDLTQELYDEYRVRSPPAFEKRGMFLMKNLECFNLFQLEVRAFDLGEPSLESTVSILIRVRQVVTVSPESGVGFAELEHRVDLPENVERGGLVAILPLEKKPPVEKRLRIR